MSLLGVRTKEIRKTWRLEGGDEGWEIYISADKAHMTITVDESLDDLDVEITVAIAETLTLAVEWLNS